MAVSSRSGSTLLAGVAGLCLAVACVTGGGTGSAIGQVWAPDCGLNGEPFSLEPNFFAMQPSTSVEIIDIRMQRGSDIPNLSNGISFFLADPEMIKDEMLGVDIEIQLLDSPVEMTLYLNSTCGSLRQVPVVYRAVSGTIRFDELFVFWVDNENQMTTAEFTDVEFVDTDDPDNRRAVLSGNLSFLFERGRPAQNFSL